MSVKTDKPRVNFASIKNPLPFPDFLEVQLKSFRDFLQLDTPPEQRKNQGLYKVFAENFPIEDTRNSFKLEFLDYYIDPPRYSIDECLERGLTYFVPLKAKLKLSCTDPDHEDFDTTIQDVYLGPIPYMTDQGTFIIKLKSFEERQKMEGPLKYIGVHNLGSGMVLGMIYKQTAAIKGAQILAFQPPMVQGFSATNGLTFSMQDRTGGDVNKFYDVTQKFIAELNKRPEITNAMTSYDTKYPQYKIDVDVAKCKQSGIDPSTVLSTMQGYYGGMYASNFNAYGKLYRVYIQADPKDRADLKSLDNIFVRTSTGAMAPINEYVTLSRVYGPQEIDRFNLFTSINVNASAADGYSTGDALNAMAEVAKTSLPTGYSYEFSGLTRNEQESSNSTGIIFVLCLTFVYLILAAQYESYLLPLSVILSIPFGLAGAFLFTNMFGNNNDIYMQIALIMLMGLLAKNAILIVQFALERRLTGMAISWSAVLGAAARLRPILMTSLAMIIGLLPMLMPWGVGYHGNMTLGAAAIGGMLIGMLCQIMIVPALFYIFQTLQEKVKPIEFEDDNASVDTEIRQYTNPYVAGALQSQIDKSSK